MLCYFLLRSILRILRYYLSLLKNSMIKGKFHFYVTPVSFFFFLSTVLDSTTDHRSCSFYHELPSRSNDNPSWLPEVVYTYDLGQTDHQFNLSPPTKMKGVFMLSCSTPSQTSISEKGIYWPGNDHICPELKPNMVVGDQSEKVMIIIDYSTYFLHTQP